METNQKMKLIALLILTLRGTPCLYYGEEIGIQERRMKRSEIQDPVGKRYWPFMQGRDGARTPMQWNSDGGFSTFNPWNPYGHTKTSVQDQKSDPDSLWNTYRNLIHIRKKERTLQTGDMSSLDVIYQEVLIYERYSEGEHFWVFINMSSTKRISLSISDDDGDILYSCGDVLQSKNTIQLNIFSGLLFRKNIQSSLTIQDI